MYRIVVWDPEKIGLDWFDRYANTEILEIVDVISMSENEEGISIELLMEYDDAWDYLLVLARQLYSQAKEIVARCGIPYDRVIYPLDAFSLCEHSEVSMKIFCNNVDRRIAWAMQKKYNDYVTCSVDGLSYLAPSGDNTIIANMYINNENWAKDDMEKFHELSQKYYKFSDEQRYFCDIGANIGTTCIYFKKEIDPNVKIFAVEAVLENYKLLRINMMLNNLIPEEEMVLNCAVGAEDDHSVIYLDSANSGGNSLVRKGSNKTQKVTVRSLDSLFSEFDIAPHEIKYLWIDVEGFELPFFKGALATLSDLAIPIIVEFNPRAVDTFGGIDKYIEVFSRICSGYIIMQEAEETVHPITDLSNCIQFEVLDLFLIR